MIKKITNRIKMKFSKINPLGLNSRIEKLEKENIKIKNDNYRVEKELFKMYKTLEYKLYQFNKYTNLYLYSNYIQLSKDKNNYNFDFEPKVSIIIPVYNGANYMKQAIDSALNQTYKNIEIIVINDGSNDNGRTDKIAKSYGNKIKYYIKDNGGVSSALNLGIHKMKGEYFCWLSHDDLYMKNNVEELINYLRSCNPRENIIPYTNFNMIDENSDLLFNETVTVNIHCFDYKISLFKNEYSLLQGEINGGSVLIPRVAFEEFGMFNEKLRCAQERDMWSRLIKKYKFINIPIETTSIRTHSNQVTNTNPKILEETENKIIEILNNMDINTMNNLEGSKINFYIAMKQYYKIYSRENLEKHLNDKIKKLNKDKKGA